MSKIGYIMVGMVSGVIGLMGGVALGKYLHKPRITYYQDVNDDGLKDIEITNYAIGNGISFIQQPDGTYKSLDDHLESQREKTEAQIKLDKSTIDTKLTGLGKLK